MPVLQNPENPLNPMQIQSELTALQKRFAEAQDYQRRYTYALALTACISIGLSLISLLHLTG
jgi:hypothetical protein